MAQKLVFVAHLGVLSPLFIGSRISKQFGRNLMTHPTRLLHAILLGLIVITHKERESEELVGRVTFSSTLHKTKATLIGSFSKKQQVTFNDEDDFFF